MHEDCALYSSESSDTKVRLVYEWFAGWRWELWRHGVVRDESLRNFEDKDDCARDAQACAATGRSPNMTGSRVREGFFGG